MANEDQLRILRQGVEAWNKWRIENPEDLVDLSRADLRGIHLNEADLRSAHLTGADLISADLREAHLDGAHLNWAYLIGADLRGAYLTGADLGEAHLNDIDLKGSHLTGADLSRADLNGACLTGADLKEAHLNGTDLNRAQLNEAQLNGADLRGAILVETNLEDANLTGCLVYGISAWGLKLKGATQKDLVITPFTPVDMSIITVDNLEVAQLIYLFLDNDKIREVVDTITTKVVLILGRFTNSRKSILEALKEELRRRDYLPVLFDFDGPKSRDLTETISVLAHMSRFVIADITDAKSIAAELQHIVPSLPSVPVIPVILDSDYEYALFEHIRRFPSVLEPIRYEDQAELITSIGEKIIAPAETKVKECRPP